MADGEANTQTSLGKKTEISHARHFLLFLRSDLERWLKNLITNREKWLKSWKFPPIGLLVGKLRRYKKREDFKSKLSHMSCFPSHTYECFIKLVRLYNLILTCSETQQGWLPKLSHNGIGRLPSIVPLCQKK